MEKDLLDRDGEREGEGEREGREEWEREARLGPETPEMGLKMGPNAHCHVLLREPISDLNS